jgi:surfeit locus 1 family protein
VRKLWPLLLTSAIGIAILCGLGTWQVFRLAEKTKLIAQLEARMNGEPVSLADALDRQAKGEDIEYVKIFARGHLDTAHSLAKISSYDSRPGWEIIAPFTSEDGIFVLADAGASPEKQIAASSADTMTGIIRLHKKGRGYFDNDNDISHNEWFWWDIPEMLAAAAPPAEAKIATFIVQKLPDNGDQAAPFAQAPKVELSNNHLGYAITWFGLATALMAVAGFFARSLVLDRGKREG